MNIKNSFLPLILLTACSSYHDANAPAPAAQSPNTPAATAPPDPVVAKCEVDKADYVLDTHVMAYEFVNELKVDFGFNIPNQFFNSLDVSIPIKKSQLVLSMTLAQPQIPNRPVASAVDKSYDLEIDANINIDFGAIALHPDLYWTTPLTNLSDSALKTTFGDIAKSAGAVAPTWNTWVIQRPQFDQVVITAGTSAGIKIGDQFKIYNVQHIWQGEPCKSEYVMARKTTRDPVAVGAVVQQSDFYSVLKILPPYTDFDMLDIENGALVEVDTLTGNNRPPLGRSLRIGEFTSEKLTVKGKPDIELVPLLLKQLKPIILKKNYVIW